MFVSSFGCKILICCRINILNNQRTIFLVLVMRKCRYIHICSKSNVFCVLLLSLEADGMTNNSYAVPTYMLSGDFQAREFVGSSNAKKNPPSNNYSFSEQQLPQVPETDSIIKGNFAVQSVHSNGSLQSTLNPVQEHPSSPVEEPAEEPHKHTYASIV